MHTARLTKFECPKLIAFNQPVIAMKNVEKKSMSLIVINKLAQVHWAATITSNDE